uniref:Transportin-1 n=1 Tax=Dracunculus medinensis TaxID=318479 RepID=A0A0N4U2Z0_DRAME
LFFPTCEIFSPDTETQKKVQERLDQLNSHPEFVCYLAYILSRLRSEQVTNRSLSGLILKNCVRQMWNQLPEQIHLFIKNEALSAISDPDPLIKATVGIIITTIVLNEGIAKWPSLIPTLCEMLCTTNIDLQMGALGALQKICEDSAEVIFLHLKQHVFLQSFNEKIFRALSINTLNSILMVHLQVLKDVVDLYVSHLFRLAGDADGEVQKQLCRALTLLLDIHLDKLAPHLANITEFMLIKTQDGNQLTALEACEFWLALADNSQVCKHTLLPYLPRLIPVLVRCMRYSPDDLILLKADVEDDSAIPDRQEDIRLFPFNEIFEESMDDDDDFDDDSSMEWNLRKCSAASLDVLSGIFGDEFLPVLLPILRETLTNEDWLIKESGILALGAVAEGCMAGIKPHLPQLIPFLINSLDDRKALVRSITCWTLSRYCQFVMQQDHNLYFKKFINWLILFFLFCSTILISKRVQEAACSAFATLEEEASTELVPYLSDIISTLSVAFQRYQAKNLLILYDAVGTLADSVGAHLINPSYLEALMTPLMAKWSSLTDDDRELFPLLECMSSVVTALHSAFAPFAKPVFDRCIQLAKERPGEAEMPDKDFLVVALDLLSSLTESLGEEIDHFVGESNIIAHLYQCSMDPQSEVRQSAFALLGDLTKTSYHRLQSHLDMIMSVLCQNINPEQVSVCNNSIWAIGEISLKSGEAMKKYVESIIPNLIFVISREKIPKTLMENTAITIGRMGITCYIEIAPYMSYFLRPWCLALRNVRDNPEKESAFRGLCYMVNVNPAGVIEDFIFFCDAIASWNNPSSELKNMFEEILCSFRDKIGHVNWTAFISQFPPPLQQRLAALYNIWNV